MSLIPRINLFKELRKAFRALEEPLLHHSPRSVAAPTSLSLNSSPLFKAFGLDSLADLSGFKGAYVKEAEDGKNYLVEAELPGVKKENLKVEFSDNGEVLHIQGFKGSLPSSSESSSGAPQDAASASSTTTGEASSATTATSDSKAVEKTGQNTSVVPDWATESFNYGTFHETFRFPSPVDVDKVQASYEDGMLRLTIPKTEKDIQRKAIDVQ